MTATTKICTGVARQLTATPAHNSPSDPTDIIRRLLSKLIECLSLKKNPKDTISPAS